MKRLLLALSIVLIMAGCDNGDMKDKDQTGPQTAPNPLIGTWENNIGEKKYTFTSDTAVTVHNGLNYDMTPIDYFTTYTFDGEWVVMVFGNAEPFNYSFKFYDKNRKRLYDVTTKDSTELPEGWETGNRPYYTKKNGGLSQKRQ